MKKFRLHLTADTVILVMASIVFAVSVILLFTDKFFRDQETADDLKRVGKVALSENDVRRKIDGGLIWGSVGKEDDIFEGDAIFTAADSNAMITLEGKGELEVSPRSLVVIRTQGADLNVSLAYGSLSGKIQSGQTINVITEHETQTLTGDAESKVRISRDEGSHEALVEVASGRVKATGRGGTQVASANEKLKLTPGAAPVLRNAEIVPTSPQPGASLWMAPTESLKLEWAPKGDVKTDQFVVEVASDSGFKRVLKKVNATGTHAEFSSSERPHGPVYWRVRAANDRSLASRPAQLNVYTDGPASLKAPGGGKPLTFNAGKGEAAAEVPLAWQDDAGSTQYKVEVSDDPEFKNIVHSRVTTAPSDTTPPLKAGSYFWRVTGLNSQRPSSPASEPGRFEVRATGLAPEKPSVATPLISYELPKTTLARLPASTPESAPGVIPDQMPPYTWQPVANAKEYEVEVANNDAFTGSKKYSAGQATKFTLPEVRPGSYFMRVRAKDENGLASDASAPTRLDVLVPSPETVQLKNETEKFASDIDAQKAKHEFDFKWTPRPFAAGYELEVSMDENFKEKQSFQVPTPSKKVTVTDSAQFYYRVRALASTGKPISTFSEPKSALYKKLAATKPVPTPTPAPKPTPSATPVPVPSPAPTPKVAALQHPVLSPESTEPQPDTEVYTMPGAPTYVPFRWKKVKDASGYTLQVSSDPTFTNILAEATVRSSDYVLQERLPSGRVYWRVRAEKKDKAPTGKVDYSEWSKPSSLNVTYGKK